MVFLKSLKIIKQKWVFCLIIGVLTLSAIAYYKYLLQSATPIYVKSIEIEYCLSERPFAKVEIESQEHSLLIDLGSYFSLSLDENILNTLSKKTEGERHYTDLQGISYTMPTYRIPQMKMGGITYKNVPTSVVNKNFTLNTTFEWVDIDDPSILDVSTGIIGRPLLVRDFLVLDFPHSKLILTNSYEECKKSTPSLNHAIEVPFEMHHHGILIHVTTELGILHLIVDTGSTLTMIKEHLANKEDCPTQRANMPIFNSSSFILNNMDFGPHPLHLYNLFSQIPDVDGILGMDFLKHHTICFDFHRNLAHIHANSGNQTP